MCYSLAECLARRAAKWSWPKPARKGVRKHDYWGMRFETAFFGEDSCTNTTTLAFLGRDMATSIYLVTVMSILGLRIRL